MTMTPKEAIQHARETMGLTWAKDDHVEKVTGVVAELAGELGSPETVARAVQALWLPADRPTSKDLPSVRQVQRRLADAVPTLASGETEMSWVQVVSWAALRVAVGTEPKIAAIITLMRSTTEWRKADQRLGTLSNELVDIACDTTETERVVQAEHYNPFDGWAGDDSSSATTSWTDIQPMIDAGRTPHTTTLTDAVTRLHERAATTISALEQQTKGLPGAVRHVEAHLTRREHATLSTAQEINLLWWGQSLYSPSLHRSYRDIPANHRALWMANDITHLSDMWPSEARAAYFTETLRRLNPDLDAEITIKDHAARLIEAATLERDLVTAQITNEIPAWLTKDATCLPISFILKGVAAGTNAEEILRGLAQNLGVNLERGVTHRQWATWILRERCLLRFLHDAWQEPTE